MLLLELVSFQKGNNMMLNLYIESLYKSYGSINALSDINLIIEPGITAILGPNGSGKSTFMNILSGNLKASGGQVNYDIGDGMHKAFNDAYRGMLGFMPQYPGLYPNFTIAQFMRYMAALKNVGSHLPKKEKREYVSKKITEILNEVELCDQLNYRIDSLSGGMKQRLALAQSILGDSSILLLDEPTAGLDPKQRISVRNYISKIAFNKIVLIATHVVSDVEFIASKIIILKKGKIVDYESPQVLCNRIKNFVWNVPCLESDIANIQKKAKIISISKDVESDRLNLRALSENAPTNRSFTVTPTLEDYYLYIFNE